MPVWVENTAIRPEVLGKPRLGLSKNPGDILIAKEEMPGTYAVLTSTSPLYSAIAIDRMGGITTSPDANFLKPASTQTTAFRSKGTSWRNSACVSNLISGMRPSYEFPTSTFSPEIIL